MAFKLLRNHNRVLSDSGQGVEVMKRALGVMVIVSVLALLTVLMWSAPTVPSPAA